MTEWRQNEGDFRIKGFALLQKYPSFHHHSVIPSHSRMTKLLGMKWKWLERLLNDISPLWFSFLVIQGWGGVTGWGGNDGALGSEQKIWDLKNLSFRPHPVIWSSFHNGSVPLIQCVKSIRPTPSAEGVVWIKLSLHFWISSLTHSHHPWIIPSFRNHSSHYKREVNPPDPLCRGGWVDWLDA